MSVVFSGILIGLGLSILIGPLIVLLTQTGLQYGIRAGITAGAGIWISDILLIVLSWYFIQLLNDIVLTPSFRLTVGVAGGVILIGFGLYNFLSKPVIYTEFTKLSSKNYLQFFVKGFTINFVNPFTLVFWVTLMTSYVSSNSFDGRKIFILFASIMIVIMTTDTLKVVLAKSVRNFLKQKHIQNFNKISGIIFMAFGLILMIRSFL